MSDANTSPTTGDDSIRPEDDRRHDAAGVTGVASRAVHGVADAGKAVVHKAQDAAKEALPDAVPDVADKIVDAAAGFATARIDQNVKIADGVLGVTRGTGRVVRIAAVIAAVAIVAVLIARRA